VESVCTGAVTTPDLTEWPALLKQRHPFASDNPLSKCRETARQRLIAAAEQYMLRLSDLAKTADVPLPTTAVLTGNPDNQPVIMTGHQPVVFHAGLVFKYECTEQSASGAAIGTAVIIDTDEGDPGTFFYPRADTEAKDSATGQLILSTGSFCESTGLYGSVSLLPAELLVQRATEIRAGLEFTTTPSVQHRFRQVSDVYCRLATAGATAAEANSIVRWSRKIGSRLLELPLSAVCSFPEVMKLTAGILENFESFAGIFNHQLKDYRTAHGIRNPANPFPDLQTGPQGIELPFWVMSADDQSRRPLYACNTDGGTTLSADGEKVTKIPSGESLEALNDLLFRKIQLIPRGALITSFLRLLFADLFVHGTGGGNYDRFTDRFIETWWNVQPPPFVVATASRFLFAERRSRISELQKLQKHLRDLRFNPQRHFGIRQANEAWKCQLS